MIFIRKAASESDLEKVFNVTNTCYNELGYVSSDYFPDEFTPKSVHFLAERETDGEPVGAIRLVIESGIGLPMDKKTDVSELKSRLMEEGRKYVEVSGYAVNPINMYKTKLNLIEIIYKYSVRNNITDFLAAVNADDIDFHLKMGVDIVGDRFFYQEMNRDAYPIHIPVDGFAEPYRTRFSKPNENIVLD